MGHPGRLRKDDGADRVLDYTKTDLGGEGRRRKKTGVLMARMNRKDLGIIAGLLEAGKVKPVIDRRYPLSETAAAMRYLEEGHAKGKVVITM